MLFLNDSNGLLQLSPMWTNFDTVCRTTDDSVGEIRGHLQCKSSLFRLKGQTARLLHQNTTFLKVGNYKGREDRHLKMP